MSAAKRREAREAAEEPVLVYITTRKGGGVVLEEAEVPRSAIKTLRKKPPEALAIVGARLSGWVIERFSR